MEDIDAVVEPLVKSAEGALETGAETSLNAVLGVAGFFVLNPAMGGDPGEDRKIRMMGKGGNQRHSHTDFEQLSDEELEALLKDPKTSESDKQKIREQQKANRTRNAAKRGGKKQKAPPVKNDPASMRARQKANQAAAPTIVPTSTQDNSSVTTTEQYNLPKKDPQ